MRSVFDNATRNELIGRINTLNENSTAQWGTMTVFQALKHCTLWDKMIIANKIYKRVFIGRIFGKLALKSELKDASPLRRNSPTIPDFIVTEKNGNVVAQKAEWINQLESYANYSEPTSGFIHPFFGKMTKEQIGYLAYKHADHHLRQFNA